MPTALVRIKGELKRRMHQPVPHLGRWLGSVVRGHMAYYAVPGNVQAVRAFRKQVTRLWLKTLRHRSQRTTITWARMSRLEVRLRQHHAYARRPATDPGGRDPPYRPTRHQPRPVIIKLWENVWAEFVPFLAFDNDIRSAICTTTQAEPPRLDSHGRHRSHDPNRAGHAHTGR